MNNQFNTALDRLSSSYEQTYLYAVFCELLAAQPELMHRLVFLREVKPDAYLAAGVIRNLVWSLLHQQSFSISGTEIDVVYFDQSVAATWHEEEQQLSLVLQQAFPDNDWDVVNQAYVHHWYRTEQAEKITAYGSLDQALSCWPETATAIAVALDENDQLRVVAPFGVSDLMQLIVRWNNALVSQQTFLQRVQQKQFLKKWPKLKVFS